LAKEWSKTEGKNQMSDINCAIGTSSKSGFFDFNMRLSDIVHCFEIMVLRCISSRFGMMKWKNWTAFFEPHGLVYCFVDFFFFVAIIMFLS
jgi:hypothetical protein